MENVMRIRDYRKKQIQHTMFGSRRPIKTRTPKKDLKLLVVIDGVPRETVKELFPFSDEQMDFRVPLAVRMIDPFGRFISDQLNFSSKL